MEENATAVFKTSCSRSATIGGIAIAMLLAVPFASIIVLGSQGPTFFLVFMGALLVLLPGVIVYLTLAGKNMRYEIDRDELTVKFVTKIRTPYSLIRNVEMVNLTLLLRLFGGSWPGFHWGLFRTTHGNAHVYATTISGTFILISLADGRKIAITPAEPEAFMDRINVERNKFGTATAKNIKLPAAYSKKLVSAQIAIVTGAFLVFLGYFLWIYPSLSEIVPVHFNLNWVPDRWASKSELLFMAGLAAFFPALNGFLVLKFGKYEKILLVFLGIVFVLVEALFFSIVYGIQGFP